MTNNIETNLDKYDRGGQKEVVTSKQCVECNAITAALFSRKWNQPFLAALVILILNQRKQSTEDLEFGLFFMFKKHLLRTSR